MIIFAAIQEIMRTNFAEELRWRGMLQDMMPGTEEQLNKEMTIGYIGFDPTADSLGVGNLVQVMTLLHFQKAGHKPIALVGGATGMVGDPSGKSAERNLLSEESLRHNQDCQRKQLEKFLDFNCGENSAEIVNNYDWFKGMSFLDFIRDTGKHITVNYMLAKDSVKNRISGEDREGMSFTEFSYQLIQGYDFYHLCKHKNVKLQMGGSDQWGNIVTGTELIRRKNAGDAFALTTPLIKKADGTKFGKSESGNVWLDAKRTSPYAFYQFWLNASDADAAKYIRIFTLMKKEEIEAIEAEHAQNPGARALQKALAKDVTSRVHSEADHKKAEEITEIFFKGSVEDLRGLSADDLDSIYQGLGANAFELSKQEIENGLNVLELVAVRTNVYPSKGEAKKNFSLMINKEKVADTSFTVKSENLLHGKYLIMKKGNKFFMVKAV
jgi:tyrosyl-tRNA synthetase